VTAKRKPQHAVGDVLPIYQKPISKEDLEGTAKLVKFLGPVADHYGYEEETYERIIAP